MIKPIILYSFLIKSFGIRFEVFRFWSFWWCFVDVVVCALISYPSLSFIQSTKFRNHIFLKSIETLNLPWAKWASHWPSGNFKSTKWSKKASFTEALLRHWEKVVGYPTFGAKSLIWTGLLSFTHDPQVKFSVALKKTAKYPNLRGSLYSELACFYSPMTYRWNSVRSWEINFFSDACQCSTICIRVELIFWLK